LNGKFQVFVGGTVATTIDFPSVIEFPLPTDISLQNLPDAIGNALAGSATSFVTGLIKSKEQWAKLAGILFAEQASELAVEMACRKLIDTATAAALEAAGAAVLTALAAGVAIGAGLLGIAAGAVTAIFTGGGGHDDNSDNDTPGAPYVSALEFINTGQIKISWGAAAGAAAYNFKLADPANKIIITENNLNVRQKSVVIPLNFNGGTYLASVQSVRGTRTSAWTTKSIAKVPDPTQVVLNFYEATNRITLSWASAANSAHAARLFPTSHPTQGQPVIGTNSFAIDVLAPGTYRGGVQAVGDSNNVASQEILSSNSLTKLSPPTNLQVAAEGAHLRVRFEDSEPTATTFQIIVGNIDAPTATYSGPEKNHLFDAGAYPVGAWPVHVSAKATGLLSSNFADSAIAIQKLAAPQTVELTGKPGQEFFTLSWNNAVDKATGFAIQLIDESRTPNVVVFDTTVAATVSRSEIAIPAGITGSMIIKGQVKAQGNNTLLDSNFRVSTNRITRITNPQDFSLTIMADDYGQQVLKGSWKNVVGNKGYHAQLLDASNTNAVVVENEVQKDGVEWFVHSRLLGDKTGPFVARIKTIAASAQELDSLYGPPVSISRIAGPQDFSLSIMSDDYGW
ncbi:MAG: hypothetical protein ABIQ93_15580, partial [Saprospiraceae bacterium]